MTRTVIVYGSSDKWSPPVAAYLPDNYKVVGTLEGGGFVVEGEDVAGWTLDDYVIPRLASGGMYVSRETHPQ
jgi:hypothetical protein